VVSHAWSRAVTRLLTIMVTIAPPAGCPATWQAILLLERLAASDPDAKGPFSVRARAAEALAQIR
jgi:hypothetical protein